MKRIQATRRPRGCSSSDDNPLGSLGGEKKKEPTRQSSTSWMWSHAMPEILVQYNAPDTHTRSSKPSDIQGCLDIVRFVLLFLLVTGGRRHIISHNWLNYVKDHQQCRITRAWCSCTNLHHTKGLKGIWRDMAFVFGFACRWGLLSDLLSGEQ